MVPLMLLPLPPPRAPAEAPAVADAPLRDASAEEPAVQADALQDRATHYATCTVEVHGMEAAAGAGAASAPGPNPLAGQALCDLGDERAASCSKAYACAEQLLTAQLLLAASMFSPEVTTLGQHMQLTVQQQQATWNVLALTAASLEQGDAVSAYQQLQGLLQAMPALCQHSVGIHASYCQQMCQLSGAAAAVHEMHVHTLPVCAAHLARGFELAEAERVSADRSKTRAAHLAAEKAQAQAACVAAKQRAEEAEAEVARLTAALQGLAAAQACEWQQAELATEQLRSAALCAELREAAALHAAEAQAQDSAQLQEALAIALAENAQLQADLQQASMQAFVRLGGHSSHLGRCSSMSGASECDGVRSARSSLGGSSFGGSSRRSSLGGMSLRSLSADKSCMGGIQEVCEEAALTGTAPAAVPPAATGIAPPATPAPAVVRGCKEPGVLPGGCALIAPTAPASHRCVTSQA